jgi:putative transposase
MKNYETLSHVRWNCKYHLVFILKCRHRTIYGEVRKKIGGIIRDLCRQKGIELYEGHAMPDHVFIKPRPMGVVGDYTNAYFIRANS